MNKPCGLVWRNRTTYAPFQWRNIRLILFKNKYNVRSLIIKDEANRFGIVKAHLLKLTDNLSTFNLVYKG